MPRAAATAARNGIGHGAAGNMPLLNLEAGVAHRAGGIFEQKLLLGKAHLPEQVSRLRVTIIIDGTVPIFCVRTGWWLQMAGSSGS
jgi:hypothetical protein